MQVSIRELRSSMKSIFQAIETGEEVSVLSHHKPIAKIIRLGKPDKKDIGFAMWADREDLDDATNFVRNLRQGRQHAL